MQASLMPEIDSATDVHRLEKDLDWKIFAIATLRKRL